MVELLLDIARFVWAILSHWQAYMTGGIIIAALGAYERLIHKNVSTHTFAIGVTLFFIVALFMTWRDEYRGRLGASKRAEASLPDLHGEFLQTNSHPLRGGVGVLVVLRVKNTGGDSIINDWAMSVAIRGAVRSAALQEIPNTLTLTDTAGQTVRYYGSDAIYDKTSSEPIKRGGSQTGLIWGWFNGMDLSELDTHTVAVSFSDVADRRYTIKPRQVFPAPYPERFPGLRRP
jgi:hypothetical protein